MGGVAQPPEHHIRCLDPVTRSGGDRVLRFDLDGRERGISLRIERLNRNLVAGLPDRALDLLELAALVYAADACVSRGGTTLQQMGRKWHRSFTVEMAVRDPDFWRRSEVGQTLEELLMFLSGDRFRFEFVLRTTQATERTRFFRFDDSAAWTPDRVLMFSGGLDSFAGALEEIVRQGQSVALISHFSATKIAPVQRDLHRAIQSRLKEGMARHVPIQVQMAGKQVVEGTHRSRSFLFAVLGAIAAQAFGRNRVSFYENGVVSLNLPPVGNVLGTRATRTTHPKTLVLMSGFLGTVFEGGMRIDNPFFWHTKTEVLKTISDLGMADQIARTRSCADVHNQTKQYPHCGRCSQCIDRRFAALAAGLGNEDPDTDYRVDLFTGNRVRVEDREMALSYVRNAESYEQLTPDLLVQHFPAVLDAVDSLGEPAPSALARIADLLKRHGQAVTGVMRDAMTSNSQESFPKDSLPRLYGQLARDRLFAGPDAQTVAPINPVPQKLILEFAKGHRSLRINDVIEFRSGATLSLLRELADTFLEAAGQGRDPLDYPAIRTNELAKRLHLESDEAVRQRVVRSRGELVKKFRSAGLDPEPAKEIIENLPGQGYRLNPLLVEVRMTAHRGKSGI